MYWYLGVSILKLELDWHGSKRSITLRMTNFGENTLYMLSGEDNCRLVIEIKCKFVMRCES